MVEELISEVQKSKIHLTASDHKTIDSNFQTLFKGVDLDQEEIFPHIIVVSTILGMIISQILRFWKKEIPKLSSDVELLDLVKSSAKFNLSIDHSIWNSLKTATRIFQEIIPNDSQIQLKSLIATCDFHSLLGEDILGSLIQKCLPPSLRKALAANYTSLFSSELLAKLAINGDTINVIDPFCGSGRLLTAVLDQTLSNSNGMIQVVGNELLGIAGILTLTRLLYWFQVHQQLPNLRLTVGDAFEHTQLLPPKRKKRNTFQGYDLIIMNPPFTRYLRLHPNYLNHLFRLYQPYQEFMEKQMGLHVFSLFLADQLLKPRGRLAAVLPAPTFYSQYANGLKQFLAKNYQIKFVIGTTVGKSFSEGSDLKEILFIADKLPPTATTKTTFATITSPLTKDNITTIVEGLRTKKTQKLPIKILHVRQQKLESDWNWTRFLEIGALQTLAERLRHTNRIKSAQELNLRIVRGFEMYGPDFFFLPNTNWDIIEQNSDSILVKHKEKELLFDVPKEWLSRSLRRPGLYKSWITPEIDHYALTLSKDQDTSHLKSYITTHPETWQVAERRFGKGWITHIHSQLTSKRPYGHLFLVDKFGITSTGTMAHFTDDHLTASKNFYVVDCSASEAKLLAAWLNSTIYILLFLASRREIGGAYGRLQIIDYQREQLFINPHTVDPNVSKKITPVFDTLRSQSLPALKDQLSLDTRKNLDLLFLYALGFQEKDAKKIRKSIYQEVSRLFKEIDARSRHKRKRN